MSGLTLLGAGIGCLLAVALIELHDRIKAAQRAREDRKPPSCERCRSATTNHPDLCAACAGPDGEMP